MKSNKILAKVLAAAVVVTSILPGSLTAQASPKIQTETTSQWMYKKADKTFSLTQDNWLNAETNAKFDKWGPTKLVGAGISTWRLASSATDGNTNEDMSVDTGNKETSAPACVYASGIDITSQTDERKVMRFVFYPQDDYQYDQIRLGIMLKYVDSNHWAFLGYNGSDWWVQWRMGNEGNYADASHGYTNSAGETVAKWNPESGLRTMRMGKDQHFRITLTYEDASHIKLRMAVCDRVEDEEGKPVLVEKADTAKEAVLDFKVFEELRNYAQEGGTVKKIHMGFVAGTHPSSTNKPLTDINIENVMMGALVKNADGENNPTAESTNAADWKTPLALINYEDCDWVSPKAGKDAEDILIQQIVGEGLKYAAIGNPEDSNKKNPNATIYNKTVTDFTEGEVSAILRPYEIGSGKEFYLGVLSVPEGSGTAAQAAGKSIKLGINNNQWGYKIDDGAFQSIGSEPAIKALTDYNVTMKIDDQGKVTAKVAYEKEAAGGTVTTDEKELLGANSNVNVKGLSGAVSITALGESLRVREVICKKVTSDTTPLEKKYEELKDKNAEYTYYNDVWNTFKTGKLEPVKTALDATNAVLTADSADYAKFNDVKAQELQSAFNAIDKAENKVATGKAELQTAYNAVENIDLTTETYTKYYTEASIAAFGTARGDVKTFLESLNADDFAGINKTDISDKKASISTDRLIAKAYTKDEAAAAVDAELKKVLENEDGTAKYDEANGAKYYDNWEEFSDALQAVRDLKGSESVTITDLEQAIAALEEAAAKLTDKAAQDADKAALTSAISGIETDVAAKKYLQDNNWSLYTKALQEAKDAAANAAVTVKDLDAALARLNAARAALKEDTTITPPPEDNSPKKGDVKKVGNASYTIVDPAAATVTLKTGDKNAKNVNINTVKIDGKTYKVIGIGKNAFANSKKLKSVTIGKNVKSIQANAFKKCTSLKKVTFKGTAVSTIAKNSFKGSKVTTVKVPKKLKKNAKFLKKVKQAGIKVKKLS